VRDSGYAPLEGGSISANSIAVIKQTGGRTNGKEQSAVAEIGLVAVVFGDEACAAISKQALDESPGLHGGIAVQGELVGGVIEHVAAEREGPAGEARGINAQLITSGRSCTFSGTTKGGHSGFAGHFFELFGSGGRGIVAKFFQPVHVVVHDFHGAVGGQAKALVVEQGEHVLGKEAGEEIILLFFGYTVFGMVDQFVHIEHGVCQLIGRDLILVANNHIGHIRGVQDRQHLVEDIAIASGIFRRYFDAVGIGGVEVLYNFCNRGFAFGAGVLVPPNNFFGGNNASPRINHWGFGRGFCHDWSFGRGFGHDWGLGRGGGFCCFSASAEHQGGNQDDCHKQNTRSSHFSKPPF